MNKIWYRSKGIVAGVLLMAITTVKVLYQWEINPTDAETFLLGLGIVGIRQATK